MSLASTLLRLTVGGFFVGHGLQKLTGAFDGPGLAGTEQMMAGTGMHPAARNARLVALTETAGGAALALGAARRGDEDVAGLGPDRGEGLVAGLPDRRLLRGGGECEQQRGREQAGRECGSVRTIHWVRSLVAAASVRRLARARRLAATQGKSRALLIHAKRIGARKPPIRLFVSASCRARVPRRAAAG